MRLQTLRLHGFKSFPDRTTLDFREGVTAIIGSNGCGKSNLADAIRWVLGEQRASVMRGAKMEEVIFQGTARRRPLNFAEVSLHFDNLSGRIPIPQSEIEVARKVFREGGSEYSLNRAACRLRDVQGLFRDTGLGSNAYAVIEATMIETLLSDRAEERRALFEEAAGIGKYKDSRHSAMRRLESAEVDLTRLDDLIAEVESKVRSLSRQKRKAERHRELQARRLDLEMAIARVELKRLEESQIVAEARRLELDESQRSAGAERSTAEATIEQRRIEAADFGRQRIQAAAKLEGIRARLDVREREALLADERRVNTELRITQVVGERAGLEGRIEALTPEIRAVSEELAQARVALEAARAEAERTASQNVEIRSVLAASRAATEAAATRSRTLAREIATGEGERAGAERRRRDVVALRGEAVVLLEGIRVQLDQLTDQTELWETQAFEVRDRLTAADQALEGIREEVGVLRSREQRAREEARDAEDRVSVLSGQIDAREALERNYEGFSPAVAAIMAARENFPGVHGPLADFLGEGDGGERSRGVESYLGPLLQALVVEDLATARALRRWFLDEWKEGGSLLLLPIEAVAGHSLPSGPWGRELGSRWVDLLLAELIVLDGDPLESFQPGVYRVGAEGEVVDARGMVRLTAKTEGKGILTRRATLRRLKGELAEASRQRDSRSAQRDDLRRILEGVETRVIEAEENRRSAEAQLKDVELDAAAHRDRRGRLQRERDTQESRLTELDTAFAEAGAQLEALEARLADLARSVEEAGVAEDTARNLQREMEVRWDSARDEEAELRVTLARAESASREAERRLRSSEESRDNARLRLSSLERELAELNAGLDSYSELRGQTAADIEQLFGERDEGGAALVLIDAALAELDSYLVELGERARVARRLEGAAAEERHGLDLQLAEGRSRIERVRERMEVEWGRPWSALLAETTELLEGNPDAWRQELRSATEQLEGVGPVNMLAVEEHAEEERRLDFLLAQRKDLVEARNNLVSAIRQINQTAREVFQSTFDAVRLNFKRTFASLFDGGTCDLWLADPDDPLESPIEIQASPVGKKTQRIHLLSGGERTLTALALLFALYLVKPSPFCLLDEVDAPLDESNVLRFVQLLQDFKHETQFIVITHNPRTMEAADWVYGVTMEEPGVSSIVGVELLGAWVGNEALAKA